MITHIQKWGNSLALRIPWRLAAKLRLEPNSAVEIRQEGGRLILIPVQAPGYTLDELLAQIQPDNLHAEVWQ
jgi:antitoxin MazE